MDNRLKFWLGRIAFQKQDGELIESFLSDVITYKKAIPTKILIDTKRRRPELFYDYRVFKRSSLYSHLLDISGRASYDSKTYSFERISNGSLVLGFLRSVENASVYEWLQSYGCNFQQDENSDRVISLQYNFFKNFLEAHSIEEIKKSLSSADKESDPKYDLEALVNYFLIDSPIREVYKSDIPAGEVKRLKEQHSQELDIAQSKLLQGLRGGEYFFDNANIYKYTDSLRYCPTLASTSTDLILNEWESYNIFSLLYIEVVECLKNGLKPRACIQCGNFMFIRRSDKRVCVHCKPPSQVGKENALKTFESRLFQKYSSDNQTDWNRYKQELSDYLNMKGYGDSAKIETYISKKIKGRKGKRNSLKLIKRK